jgi:hypothetical protein
MFRAQTATSRTRLRGTATHSATGALPAATTTTTGGNFTRRRATGAATPTATRVQAVALIPLEKRTPR